MVPNRQSRARRAGGDGGSGGDDGVGCGIDDDVLPRGKGGQGGSGSNQVGPEGVHSGFGGSGQKKM